MHKCRPRRCIALREVFEQQIAPAPAELGTPRSAGTKAFGVITHCAGTRTGLKCAVALAAFESIAGAINL
jgi:hypothetical protein